MRTAPFVAALSAVALIIGCNKEDPTFVPATVAPATNEAAGESWVITTYIWEDGEWVKHAMWDGSYLGSDLEILLNAWNFEPEYSGFQIRFDNVYAFGDIDLPEGLVDDFNDGVVSSIWEGGAGANDCPSADERACEADGVLTIYIPEGPGSSELGFRVTGIDTRDFVVHGEFDVQVDFSVDQAFHNTPNTNASLRVYDERRFSASLEIRNGRYLSAELEPDYGVIHRRSSTDHLVGKLRITRSRVRGKGQVVESVTGSGSFSVPEPAGDWRTFSFTARRYANGTVEGNWERIRRADGNAADSWSHGVVTCLTIVGNEAWLGGYATSGANSDPPNWVAWRVKDNGQGKIADPDQISGQYWARPADFTASYCARTPSGPRYYDVEAGDIQIMP